MRKLIIVVLAFIPFLLGCEPEKEEFYGVRFEQNGYQFELPKYEVGYWGITTPIQIRFKLPNTNYSSPPTTGGVVIFTLDVFATGPYNLNNTNSVVPYYEAPPCASTGVIEGHGSINITKIDQNEIEASFEYSQTHHNTCDTNLTFTNKIINGYVHQKY